MGKAFVAVIYGQGGRVFSGGMADLARQLSFHDGVEVETYGWKEMQHLYERMRRLPTSTKKVIIGFSLGANSATQVAEKLAPDTLIDLLVCYDPSIRQQGYDVGIQPIHENVQRAICYTGMNTWDPLGHGRLVRDDGEKVETYETNAIHVMVCQDQRFHKITIEAVKQLLK